MIFAAAPRSATASGTATATATSAAHVVRIEIVMTGHVAYAQRATQKLPYKWITGRKVEMEIERGKNEKSPSKRRKRFSNLPNGNHFLIKVAGSLQLKRAKEEHQPNNHHHHHRHHHHRQRHHYDRIGSFVAD